MERITYQRTLDVHKNGIQFTLQGVETGDNLSRVVEISLMASGDAIDFPLENLLPIMYVTTPKATEPSIIECTIKDNIVVYEVLPIVEEGITEMQLKLIETSPEGAKSVLVAPRFAIEVTKSNADDSSAMQKTEFTALETAVAKAKTVYDKRFLRMELTSDCIFKAYYADGTIYETDILKQLFHTGDAILAQSFAKGGTGVRANEDTDNSMYYSNVSKSASLEAKDAIKNSEEMLEEARLHGVYTAFKVDFESGEVEYVSPTYTFKINVETGDLETDGGAYSFEDEIGRIVVGWLEENNVDIKKLQDISGKVAELQTTSLVHTEHIEELQSTSEKHTTKIIESELEIAKGKAFDEWVTLGSISVADTKKYHNNGENDSFAGSIHIPIEEGITKDYMAFRLILKAGSYLKSFAVYNGSSSTAGQTSATLSYKGQVFVGANAYGGAMGDNGANTIAEVNLSEDRIIYTFLTDLGFNTLASNASKGNESIITETDAIVSGVNNISINVSGLRTNANNYAEWQLTFELQGKRW